MKKIYVSLLALGFAASVSAQNKQATNNSFNPFNGGIQKVEVADKAPVIRYYGFHSMFILLIQPIRLLLIL